jgi:hypothetical protein
VEGRVTDIARLREPISVKRSDLMKGIRDRQYRQALSPEFQEEAVRLIQSSGDPWQAT